MTGDNRNCDGFTLMELLIVVAVICIVAAVAVPALLRSRMTGNEASAIATLRVTTSSQIAYAATCGRGGFADGYVTLGTSGASTPFVPSDLAVESPVKSGFQFSLSPASGSVGGTSPVDCNDTPTVSGFYATATPLGPGSTGARAFAVSTLMTIWQNTDPTTPPTEAQMAAPPAGGVSPIAPIQ
jgi:type IV pilus assembly protein PilA